MRVQHLAQLTKMQWAARITGGAALRGKLIAPTALRDPSSGVASRRTAQVDERATVSGLVHGAAGVGKVHRQWGSGEKEQGSLGAGKKGRKEEGRC